MKYTTGCVWRHRVSHLLTQQALDIYDSAVTATFRVWCLVQSVDMATDSACVNVFMKFTVKFHEYNHYNIYAHLCSFPFSLVRGWCNRFTYHIYLQSLLCLQLVVTFIPCLTSCLETFQCKHRLSKLWCKQLTQYIYLVIVTVVVFYNRTTEECKHSHHLGSYSGSNRLWPRGYNMC